MFEDRLSGGLLSWYLQSAYKERIDRAASRLLELRYRPAVVRLYLHEWVRFARHLEERDLPLPASVHDPAVQHYLRARFPAGSASGRRGIRAAVRILLDMDGGGGFPRRAPAP